MNKYDLLLHVDKTDNSLEIAFSNAVNYANALRDEVFTMILVANSHAVTRLTKDNTAIKNALEQACGQGLSVYVCNNALNSTGTRAEDLFPQCRVVPAGLVEIVRLQREGFAYVKP